MVILVVVGAGRRLPAHVLLPLPHTPPVLLEGAARRLAVPPLFLGVD